MGMPEIKPSCVTRCQAITDVIASVALEQAALAHILNAEGEKIQKVVRCSHSPYKMVKVNQSVEDVIKAITKLEMLLQFKLDLFDKCLCHPCLPHFPRAEEEDEWDEEVENP